jgi:hypothetical protein
MSDRRLHHRRVENMRMPRTALANAFLRALQVWATKHHDDATMIVIPSGTVTTIELRQVVLALLAIKAGAR